MQSITFECEVITPMFLAGADGTTPELRAPSIKGALRFWWRAMNGHLSLEELKKQEIRIFGGVGLGNESAQRSSIIIDVITENDLEIIEYPLLPHREDEKQYGFPSYAKAIDVEERFTVRVRTTNEAVFSIAKAQVLFELVAILGGLGKRVRRGMGSFKIIRKNSEDYKTPISIIEIETLLKHISPYFAVQGTYINNTFSGRMENYGWIKQIEIGKSEQRFRKILTKTGKISSDLKKENPYKYEVSLGHAFKGRFASPINVSVVEDNNVFIPIITTLNTVPDRDKDKIDRTLQERYKKAII